MVALIDDVLSGRISALLGERMDETHHAALQCMCDTEIVAGDAAQYRMLQACYGRIFKPLQSKVMEDAVEAIKQERQMDSEQGVVRMDFARKMRAKPRIAETEAEQVMRAFGESVTQACESAGIRVLSIASPHK